jgi:hypothetical protein
MITIDLVSGEVKRNIDVKGEIARAHPYTKWNEKHRVVVKPGGRRSPLSSVIALPLRFVVREAGYSLQASYDRVSVCRALNVLSTSAICRHI